MNDHELYDPHDQAPRQSPAERLKGGARTFLQAAARLTRWQRWLLMAVGIVLLFVGELAPETLLPFLVAGLIQAIGWVLVLGMLLVGQHQSGKLAGMREEWSRLESAYQEVKAEEQEKQNSSDQLGER